MHVPGLHGPECARVIQDACIRYPGIKSIRPDYERQALQVTYNSMEIALKNIEYLIVMAGFDVNDLQARPEAAAKLPPECR
ncbi:MAG: heavy-metal-associated domain-containing protein [Lentisphaerae bacterium]|nr:heavy-metal-associated domain-containing protein [Lentisphaerota bacterium]